MINTLENCKMYELLTEKNCNVQKDYEAILRILEKPAGDLLEFTKTNFPNYTDHTIQHSFRILNYLYHILSSKMKDDMTTIEVFCLILAAMLHDIGMSSTVELDKNKLRKEHAILAEKPIHEIFKLFKFVPNIERIANCIVYVCESHTKDLHQMYEEKMFKSQDTINGEKVRFGYLAVLLRIGDLMDIEEDRTSYIVQKVFPEYYQKEGSEKHHKRCEELKNFNYSDKNISACVETENRENYKLWSNWFGFLKDEIIQANTYYFRDFVEGGSIAKFEYTIEPAEGANFCTEEIRFEIDDKGALWEIISKSIYTAEYDFLRELIQNSIDACLMDCYLDKELELEQAFQREWPTDKYFVNVFYSEESNELVIYDNGIGMDMNTLKKYLFKTADSGYKHINVEREFLFPAIAKFGIGFVACLTKSSNIKICTQGTDSDELLVVEIEKDSNVAFIERNKKHRNQGTAIFIKLKDKYTYTNIEKYILENFCATAIELELINLDVLKRLSGKNDLLHDYNIDVVEKIIVMKNKFRAEAEELYTKLKCVQNIISQSDTLKELLYRTNEDEVFSLDTIYLMHLHLCDLLKKNCDIISSELIKEISNFKRKEIDIEHERYKMLLINITKEAVKYRGKSLDIPIRKYSGLFDLIKNVQLDKLMNEDICIVYLDESFLIEEVEYEIEVDRIKERSGIIFIKTVYVDSASGIEFSIVNSFFFNKGVLATNLVRVRETNFTYLNDDLDKLLSSDDIYDISYQLELLFEDEEEEERYQREVRELEDGEFTYIVDILYGDGDIKVIRNKNSKKLEDNSFEDGISFTLNADYSKKFVGKTIPVLGKSLFCQDGIKIDIDISGLIPFKTGYYACNFFGDSRFELNVTRHDINRDNKLISRWLETYGKQIQEEIISNISHRLNECGIEDIKFRNILSNKGNSFFDTSAYANFNDLLKKKGLY